MDLIVVTFTDKWDDWERDGFPSRTAALTLALAEEDRVGQVLVVDVPSSIAAPKRANGGPGFSLRQVRDNVAVLDHTRLLPRERHDPLALAVNGALHDGSLAREVNRAAGELGLSAPAAIHAGPLTTGLFGRLGEQARVYDAVDEWSVHPAYTRMRGRILAGYADVRARADLVTAVSGPLGRVLAGGNARVEIVRNAVGSELLETAAPVVPDDLAKLPRPVVGYTGALEERVDADLIGWLAERMPEVSFALIGPVADPDWFAGLSGIPNAHFLGPKNHGVLYDYVRSFDACMMPHRDTPLTAMMDPVKLHEYVACGRPVVTTAVGELDHLSDFVSICHSPEEFRTQLQRVLSSEPPNTASALAYAKANCWPARAREVIDAIERATGGLAV